MAKFNKKRVVRGFINMFAESDLSEYEIIQRLLPFATPKTSDSSIDNFFHRAENKLMSMSKEQLIKAVTDYVDPENIESWSED